MNCRNAGNVSLLFAASPVTIALARVIPCTITLVSGIYNSETEPQLGQCVFAPGLTRRMSYLSVFYFLHVIIFLPLTFAHFLLFCSYSSVGGVHLIFGASCQQLARKQVLYRCYVAAISTSVA